MIQVPENMPQQRFYREPGRKRNRLDIPVDITPRNNVGAKKRGSRNRLCGDVGVLTLTEGAVATVDKEDFPVVSGRVWSLMRCRNLCYAFIRYNNRPLLLHRFLMRPPDGMVVDHIDSNGLNCTRANMRICTPRQNAVHSRRRKSASGYIGVYRTSSGKYAAYIRMNGRVVFLGSYTSSCAAADAFDRMALRDRGEYAVTNNQRSMPHD